MRSPRDTAALTQLLRDAQLVELERPVVVAYPRRVRRKVARRAAAGVLVFAGLAAAGLGDHGRSPTPAPKHPSSALGFRDLHEQRQFVRAELIRLEPQSVFTVKTAPRFAGHGLL